MTDRRAVSSITRRRQVPRAAQIGLAWFQDFGKMRDHGGRASDQGVLAEGDERRKMQGSRQEGWAWQSRT
ncbi:MAG: hypothetical protein A2Y93_06525 [Chloroflexi bacterium RBG_13_68_17]|nr:MAG: hypothetical protein A2Y93_06525 [Chloroflexi bacterium RBG_13_68_17]